MTFLELCQRARKEMGISGTGPSAVTGQSGELSRVVDWVASAYDDICSSKPHWRFLRSTFSVPTAVGQEAYTPASCTDTRDTLAITADSFADWIISKADTFRIYLTSDGASTQTNIWPLHVDSFRTVYQLQAPSNNKPVHFAIREYDNAIMLGPKPNDLYTVVGEYYRTAPKLTGDSDELLIPERFQMAVVWMAVMSYAGYEDAPSLYDRAENNYKRLYGALKIDQLPRVSLGGPIA